MPQPNPALDQSSSIPSFRLGYIPPFNSTQERLHRILILTHASALLKHMYALSPPTLCSFPPNPTFLNTVGTEHPDHHHYEDRFSPYRHHHLLLHPLPHRQTPLRHPHPRLAHLRIRRTRILRRRVGPMHGARSIGIARQRGVVLMHR